MPNAEACRIVGINRRTGHAGGSGSTLLSESAPLAVRTDVQGAADLVMGLTAAVAGALADVVVGLWGYPALALSSALLVAGIATAAEVARRTTDGVLPDDEPPPV